MQEVISELELAADSLNRDLRDAERKIALANIKLRNLISVLKPYGLPNIENLSNQELLLHGEVHGIFPSLFSFFTVSRLDPRKVFEQLRGCLAFGNPLHYLISCSMLDSLLRQPHPKFGNEELEKLILKFRETPGFTPVMNTYIEPKPEELYLFSDWIEIANQIRAVPNYVNDLMSFTSSQKRLQLASAEAARNLQNSKVELARFLEHRMRQAFENVGLTTQSEVADFRRWYLGGKWRTEETYFNLIEGPEFRFRDSVEIFKALKRLDKCKQCQEYENTTKGIDISHFIRDHLELQMQDFMDMFLRLLTGDFRFFAATKEDAQILFEGWCSRDAILEELSDLATSAPKVEPNTAQLKSDTWRIQNYIEPQMGISFFEWARENKSEIERTGVRYRAFIQWFARVKDPIEFSVMLSIISRHN